MVYDSFHIEYSMKRLFKDERGVGEFLRELSVDRPSLDGVSSAAESFKEKINTYSCRVHTYRTVCTYLCTF